MTAEGERLDRWLVASVLLHGALFTFAIFSPKLFPAFGPNWGSPTGGTGGISVKIVGSASNIPLPTPIKTQPNAPANESPGLYKNEEPAPPPKPDKSAVEIPDTKAPVKVTPPPKPARPTPPAAKSSAVPEP